MTENERADKDESGASYKEDAVLKQKIVHKLQLLFYKKMQISKSASLLVSLLAPMSNDIS